MPACRRPAPTLASAIPSHGRGAACAAATMLALVAIAPFANPPAAQAPAAPCAIETAARIVAVGDVHGAHDRFVEVLRRADLIDGRERWIGGEAVLVQTGDVVDRGPDSRRTLDLLRRLGRDAPRAGGQVHALLGNHEVMRMVGDWRYVSAGEYEAFRDAFSRDLRERLYEVVADRAAREARAEGRRHDASAFRTLFLEEVPLGYIEMRQAFEPSGDYGRWLRERPVVVTVNGILFLHGGISEAVASLGCEGINDTIRRELAGPVPEPERLQEWLSTHEDGPLWYRGLAHEPEDTFAPTLDAILHHMDARAVVVGHTPSLAGITTRFDGRVILIDTGMLGGESYPGGLPAALEIHGDVVTAIYPDRRERLAVPALAPALSPP